MERLNLKKLNDMEVREQYKVRSSNRFAALENGGGVLAAVAVMTMMMMMWISVMFGKVSEYKSFSHRGSRLLSVETA
jgi:hypothetical protein